MHAFHSVSLQTERKLNFKCNQGGRPFFKKCIDSFRYETAQFKHTSFFARWNSGLMKSLMGLVSAEEFI